MRIVNLHARNRVCYYNAAPLAVNGIIIRQKRKYVFDPTDLFISFKNRQTMTVSVDRAG